MIGAQFRFNLVERCYLPLDAIGIKSSINSPKSIRGHLVNSKIRQDGKEEKNRFF